MRYLAIRLGNYEKIKGMEWFFKKYVLQRHNIGFNFTQKLDLFGETLFFYPMANTFSQMGCQSIIRIPYHSRYKNTE